MKAITTRAKAIIATGLIVAIGGTTAALQQVTTTGAEEPNPIIEQVGDHEVRIDSLEGRADKTDAKVEQQSADIEVIQQETGVAPAAPVPSSPQVAETETATTSQPAPAPTASEPAPAPAPEPAKNPRLIMGVSDRPTTPGMHGCNYTLYDPAQNVTSFIQPVDVPCYGVGVVLPYV
jgi:hypothetical protein